MNLAHVSRADVLEAVQEFKVRGAEEFLGRYGFERAREYFLEVERRRYDSKAIMGVAHGIATGDYLKPRDLSGSEKAVKQRLEELGFTVKLQRNPPWTRDEVILAAVIVRDNEWKACSSTNPQVIELSKLLRQHSAQPPEERTPDFRNPNGVARKTVDIATQHPKYPGRATNGGQYEREVLEAFLEHPQEMAERAAAIEQAMREELTGATTSAVADLDLEASADEGGVLLRQHLRRERDPGLRRKKIAAHRRDHTDLACEACGFDFEKSYGPHGRDYIECHHRTPLHASGPTTTRLADLVLLCSNCHRMIHRSSPWLTVADLEEMLNHPHH